MLTGIDVSHWNNKKEVETLLNNRSFIIAKATEGKNFKDSMYSYYIDLAKENNKLFGAYHFAHPENNTPELEAQNYINSIYKNIGNILMALDWEGLALKYPVTWALKWLQYVENSTGVKPVFYCSANYTNNINLIKNGNYGLWVADYKDDKARTGVYKKYALRQYADKPIDLDIFNGTEEQFKKYCTAHL